MASYSVILTKSVRKKDFPKIPTQYRTKIIDVIGVLSQDPRPFGSLKLTNRGEYRIRVSIYRILYVVDDEILIVEVTNIKHRSSAYTEA
jgi:mRNA interferase RelE/StbE